ncbi:MAG TPA: TetR/AcrR family transcriptional regulator [Micromonosporaceae bacterium]|nr:TetR/AcrR family transcriptional regulator [Micromonosporaceae bacterium]
MTLPTRRQRVRAATVDEIKTTARRLLVAQGPAAVSLRAIARQMGMTAPALYRYFASHEALLEALCADLGVELVAELTQARDAVPGEQPAARLTATFQAFRAWATAHPAEFTLMFASARHSGCAGSAIRLGQRDREAARRFGPVFFDIVIEHWRRSPFPVPEPDALSPELRAQLERFTGALDLPAPVGLAYVFLSGWARLYGIVALEVFGHLDFALTDVEPLFRAEMAALSRQLGLPSHQPTD